MKQRIIILVATLVMMMVGTSVAQAQPSKTFVSSTGNDANDCSQAAPCRTFAATVPKTGAKGIITALDTSSYGIVTIDKALTIQAAPGVTALIEGGKTTDGVTINAGTNSVVVLRNLQIFTATVVGTKGIKVISVGTLNVEGCLVTGFKTAGISWEQYSCTDGVCGQLFVNDSTMRENYYGLTMAAVNASVEHCRIENNSIGAQLGGQSRITIHDCVVAGNSEAGLDATVFGGARVENCVVTNNGIGIGAINQGDYSIFLVSNTMIVGNNTGLAPAGGQIISFENNRLAANVTNGSFTSTIQQQ